MFPRMTAIGALLIDPEAGIDECEIPIRIGRVAFIDRVFVSADHLSVEPRVAGEFGMRPDPCRRTGRELRGARGGDLRRVTLPGGTKEWEVIAISYPGGDKP